MIRVGRAITAQVNQAERRITSLTEANLSAKLLQLFVTQLQMHRGVHGSDKIVCFLKLVLFHLQSQKLYCCHLSLRLITCWSQKSEKWKFYFDWNMFDVVKSWHAGRRFIHGEKNEPPNLNTPLYFPHYSLGIFSLWQWVGLHMQSACVVRQSGGRQAGRCWAPICLLSSSCLLSAHHSPQHIMHTHVGTHKTQHHTFFGCDIQAGEVEGREEEEEKRGSIYLFGKETLGKKCSVFWQLIHFVHPDIMNKITFLSLSLGLHNNEWPSAVATEPFSQCILLRIWLSAALLSLRLSI